jgi:hypothetical protein
MPNKHAFGGKSIFNKGDELNQIFYFAKVEVNTDDYDGGTIKARIKNVDDNIFDQNLLPSAFPLLPKMFHITPKVGETVMVFVPDASNPHMDRVYLGPVISQPQMQFKDNHFFTSRSMLDTGITEPKAAPSNTPENKGVNPDREHVAIQGRDNSDIIFKPNEVIIRAGKFVSTDDKESIKKFNKLTPAYIQLKHDVIVKPSNTKGTKDEVNGELGTITNVVASKINLLTHKYGTPRFKLADQDNSISDDEMAKILTDAHQLVFGDNLIEYLKLQRQAFINHVHPYHGKKPEDLSGAEDIDNYLNYDLETMLSKNIRIN